MDVATRRNDAIIAELEEWCKQHGVTLECGAVNSKGETVPVSFFLPSGIVPTVQIVTKDERQAYTMPESE